MLNEQQELAVAAMTAHCLQPLAKGQAPFFVLKGQAGTGKTFCMRSLVERVKKRLVFTAPTNKAVKVLRESITSQDYKPDCCTIYSLLGLQMLPNGEVKELKQREDTVDLSEVDVIVVDEASMVNEVLLRHIEAAAEAHPKIRWIMMGDKWQLPPVGEAWSRVWAVPWGGAELTKIMRQDNQILALSAHVRELIEKPMAALKIKSNNDGQEGVWCASSDNFVKWLEERPEEFLGGQSKAIAWRNLRVDYFNRIVRARLFSESDVYPWQEGDRITMLGPIQDVTRELENGSHPIVATTDEEGVVERADQAQHPLYPEFLCWRVLFRSDFNTRATLWILHPSMQAKHAQRVARLAAEAKANSRLWGAFWEFKDAFHPVRHAYAITAHRAQGSTYEKAYVNWRDIMLNQNRSEAYRCLYVAVTRPKKELYLG